MMRPESIIADSDISDAELSAYVDRNAEHFLSAWKTYRETGRWRKVFCPVGFWIGGGWLLYRGMWLYALLFVLGQTVFSVIVKEVLWTSGYDAYNFFLDVVEILLPHIVLGFIALRIYYRHVVRKVRSLKLRDRGDVSLDDYLAKHGGVSGWRVVLFVLLYFGVVMIIAVLI